MYRNIKWIWLDLDDTLVDFSANSLEALRRVYVEYNLGERFGSEQAWIDCYHRHNKELWEEYNVGAISQAFLRMERFRRPLVEYGYADDEARRLSVELDPVYLDYLAEGKTTKPGAHELLQYLRGQGYKIGVLSNGFNGVQQKKLVSAALDRMIDLIVLSDEIDINKPDVRIYRYAQERSGECDPSAHLMIGDNPDTDIAGALAAGWSAILYNQRAVGTVFSDDNYPVVANLIDVPYVLTRF